MSLKTYKSLSLCHAAVQLAIDLKQGGSEMRYGEEWAKLTGPAVIEFYPPHRLCPRLLSLGDPFQLLLASFAWMFPPSPSSRYPDRFDPITRMPAEAVPSAIAASVVGSGRQVLQVGNFLATFEVNGSPDAHGFLNINLVVPTGSVFEVLGHWGVRWMMLHEAVAAYAGLMVGQLTMFVLHPCAPLVLVEGVISESATIPREPEGDGVSMMAGDPADWERDARMFIDEYSLAGGYQDRFVRSVLNPAIAAWTHLVNPDIGDEERVKRCLAGLGSVRDAEWRMMLSRYAKMQGA